MGLLARDEGLRRADQLRRLAECDAACRAEVTGCELVAGGLAAGGARGALADVRSAEGWSDKVRLRV
eukprot:COSAG03_NODE_1559_length_3875_cov_3.709216_4_plen_67_part_00